MPELYILHVHNPNYWLKYHANRRIDEPEKPPPPGMVYVISGLAIIRSGHYAYGIRKEAYPVVFAVDGFPVSNMLYGEFKIEPSGWFIVPRGLVSAVSLMPLA